MQLKHQLTVAQPGDGLVKVTALCWAPNGKKLAVCTADRVVLLFDEEGIRKDKFSTKPIDRGPKNYIVRQMAFSPQSDRLAIAQSDNMVFVYKLGSEWGEKKSICNKFQHSSSITALIWPHKRPNEVVYGLAEGKVKLGQMRTHKPTNLYQTESYVTSISSNCDGNAFVSAHLDGSIYIYSFESPDRGARMIARHPCPPFALCWASSIAVGGNNGQVVFYDEFGGEEQVFDVSDGVVGSELTVGVSNPTGDGVVFGSFNALHVFSKNKDSMSWESKGPMTVENMYTVTALGWKSDGDKIALGTICGAVDLFDVCVRRTTYKGGFEITYVSVSQVIVRQMENNTRIVVRSQFGREILKTNIFRNRFVVANTTDTILLGDLETLQLSEIPWHGTGQEKFIFDNPAACMIFFAGELTIVEYGLDEILGTIRTGFVNSHVLSLRINEKHPESRTEDAQNKKVAYLLDSHSIVVRDLVSNSSVSILHDSKVDWLELNSRGNLLLFRDKRRFLHLYNVEHQTRNQLLNFCTYVQWVPFSDVVVAQNRSQLCVWYNISSPDQVTTIQIKGEVEDIERSDGKTEVIVDEGISQAVYPLDESLINFGAALDDQEYSKAMDILDKLVLTPEVEAMWKRLRDLALSTGDLKIANRCSAALGDVALSKYLSELRDVGEQIGNQSGMVSNNHFVVRSRLALISKDFKSAEIELLNQGQVEDCIALYQKYLKHDEALRIAEVAKFPRLAEMRQAHFQYLLDTDQNEKAALLKVKECDFVQAVNLFLKGGMAGKAAQIIIDNEIHQPLQLLESVAVALTRAGLFDKAGEFHERLNDLQKALDSYIRGCAYRKAVDLARRCFPGKVVELQEAWGDYLVSQKQVDMAINHYIEAKNYKKAIESALNARQYARALQLVDVVDSDTARPYYKQLARYYEENRTYELAEKCYVSAELPQLAVEMHTRLGNWEIAHKIAMSYMTEGEVGLLYINQAQKFEAKGRLKEAEKLYLAVKEKDLAINMYKKHRRYDDMIRLVQEHRADLLKETHQFLAQTLEMEGSLKDAEHHYVEAQEWHSAVNMYRSNELWDDAIRVAKFYGGINACKRVTIALLMAIGVPEGAKYLTKHGLVEAAIEHAAENGAFDLALELANHSLPKKLPDIHLKHALFLEDDERFHEAEEEFVKANKPKEAIDMYVHQQNWNDALRVAEKYDPTAIAEVYVAHAKVKAEASDYKSAEELFVNALHPELALAMYQEMEMWNDALRVAQHHLPHRVNEVNAALQNAQVRSGKSVNRNDLFSIGRSYEQSKQWNSAVDAYLNVKFSKTDNPNDLEEILERAVELARNYLPNRYVEVAIEVSKRFVNLGREESAATVLFDCGRGDEAINILIEAKKFEKARVLARGNALLKKRVDEAYQSHLVVREDTKELAEIGQMEMALDLLAKRNEWEKLWELIAREKLGTAIISKYVLMKLEEILRNNSNDQLDDAARLLGTKNIVLSENSLSILTRVTKRLLARSKDDETGEHTKSISILRDSLYKLAHQHRAQVQDKNLAAELLELLMAVHYHNMFHIAASLGLREIVAKCSITLLKYPDLIPHDKAFYLAGTAAREQGNINLAFLLLNRYVDIAEAIDSADSSYLDGSDFQDADAIPNLEIVPKNHYLRREDDREDVRTWVLSVVTDGGIEQRLPSREAVRNSLYEGLYGTDKPLCIVTGFPVHAADVLEVNNSIANRKDWNLVVSKTKTCPWTGQAQNPLY